MQDALNVPVFTVPPFAGYFIMIAAFVGVVTLTTTAFRGAGVYFSLRRVLMMPTMSCLLLLCP